MYVSAPQEPITVPGAQCCIGLEQEWGGKGGY